MHNTQCSLSQACAAGNGPAEVYNVRLPTT
jgi:hypothetical protein